MSNKVIVQLLNAPELNSYINLPSNMSNALLDSNKKIHQLAFQLSWNSSKVYVGWSGHSSRISSSINSSNGRKSDNDSIIQMDAQFGISLGLEDGLEVILSLVKNPVTSKSVELKPCSEDDWEMVELNANFLEDHILSQIKVLFLNQKICLNLEARTKVHLTVVNIDPKPKNCCLITNESEVFVQPRERKVANEFETKKDEYSLIPPTVLRSINSELFKDQLSNWVADIPDSVAFINPRSVYSINQLAELDFDYSKLVTLGKLTLMGRLSEIQSSNDSTKKSNNSGNQKNSGSNDGSKSLFHCPNQGIVTVVWTNIVPTQHIVMKDTLISTLGGDLFSLFQLSSPISAHMELKTLTVRPVFIGTPDSTQITQNTSGSSWITDLVKKWIKDNLHSLKPLSVFQIALNHGMIVPLNNPKSSVMKQNITYAYLDFSILDHFVKGNYDPPYTYIDSLSFKNLSIQEGTPLFTNELPIHPPQLLNNISTPLAPLGAVDSVINNSISCLKVGLSGEFIKQKLKVWPHSSMLLCGGKGSGKTSVAQTIIKSLAIDPLVLAYPITLSCESLVNDRVSKIHEKLQEIVLKAAFHQPSVIFLDNLDTLIPVEMEHMDSFRYRQLSEIFIDIFKRYLSKYPRISLLATGSQSQSIHPLLLSSHIFTHTFHITPPGKPEREVIINTLLTNSTVSALKNSVAHLDCSWIAGQTEGYLPTDLRSLIERALHQAAIRTIQTSQKSQLEVNQEDFRLAQEGFIPVALRGIKLQTAGVVWSDVGGLKETKAVLRETLEWPIRYSVIFKTCPLRLRSGLLLYGYPGCGKTMLASAVAKECGLNFISVKGPELLSKYIGASEKSTRDLFERAQAAKPCVLFFDEFEAIAPRRGHDSTGVTDRVVNQLLTQMDGAEGLEGVYVLAATSRPDLIDPALLRPGRLDKSLICDLPSQEDRVDILKAHATHFHLNSDIDLNWVANQCEDFTGADLQALLYNAHLHAIHQNIDSKMEKLNENEAESNGAQDALKVDFNIFNGELSKNSVAPITMSKAERDSVERRLNKIRVNKLSNNCNSISKLSNGATNGLSEKSNESPKIYITKNDIEHSLKETHSSLPKSEINRLTLIYDQFKHGKSDPSKVGKRSTLG